MRTASPRFIPLFRSEMQLRLMGLLLLEAERDWTLQELADLLNAPPSSVHRELLRAHEAGLVHRTADARPHRFRGASESPMYRPLRDLLELTVGVPLRLREALEGSPGLVAVAIHGSWARGRSRPDSDLDVVVITEGDPLEVRRRVSRVASTVGREADMTVVSGEDLRKMLKSGNPFLAKLLNDPRIDVIGSLAEAVGEIDPGDARTRG